MDLLPRQLVTPLLAVSTAIFLGSCSRQSDIIDLAGQWSVSTDSVTDSGVMSLPGSLTSAGFGDDITLSTAWVGGIADSSFFKKPEYARFREPGNIKVPFWLQPEKYFRGKAYYTRTIDIPDDWAGKRIEMLLERCHWITSVTVDGKEAGTGYSLSTPNRYDLSELLPPGKHTITLTVDNSVTTIDPGCNSHSVSDHTQGNWNGVAGRMELKAHDPVSITHTSVYPDIESRSIKIVTEIDNTTGRAVTATLDNKAAGIKSETEINLTPGINTVTSTLALGDDIRLWSEFTPVVYTLEQQLDADGSESASATDFGMREIKAADGKILVNDTPVFLRGTLDCAAFPLTGYPPTDVASWDKIYDAIKAHGLNHVRFHSWCPPEAAFISADRKGIYLQIECASWANQSTSLGDGRPVDAFIADESRAIVEAYGNHPSFTMLTYGNEPWGGGMGRYLADFVSEWKARDSRRIYSAAAGWPNIPESDYLVDINPRIQGWGQGLGSVINSKRPSTDYTFDEYTARYNQPIVSHEVGQWCVYPNFKEIEKYTGALKPHNMEIFSTFLADAGMSHLADSFLLASGKLQALCYKADIEAALRSRDMDGFQLLGIEDFPGQGTALVGVLDAFYEPKGYITGEEFSRFCSPVVPLLNTSKLIHTTADTLKADITLAHFGAETIAASTPATWSLTYADGHQVADGSFAHDNLAPGNRYRLGDISLPLRHIKAPAQLKFSARVGDNENNWNVWVYPEAQQPVADDILITDRLDDNAMKALADGGKVLLSIRKGELADSAGGDIANGFSSIFWNTAWTNGQAPHTLGILCDPAHPALASFPTDFHSDYQWWDAMTNSSVINLDATMPGVAPIVRVIDDWFTNRPLALIFEANLLGGRIMVTGIDFHTDMEARPEARQLLASLTRYMASPAFKPSANADADKIISLIKTQQQ